MASAQAQIEIAIKNVRALDNLSTKLNKLILVNKKLVTSINKLDTTFKNISKSGLGELERGSKKASKGVLTTTDSIEALTGRLKGLKREGGVALDLVGNRFKTIGKGITLQPIKGLVDEISKVPYVVKRSFQDTRTFLEILSKGGKDIVGLVSGLGALIVNVKNLGVAARTNLTNLGTILDTNATKAENFLNKMVLGIKMQNTAFALAKNTALAQQKSLPGSLLRNTLRSQAGRAGTGFGDFSQGIGEYNPYQIASPTPRYGAGKIGPIHATQHYALQSNPYMGQFDNATQKSIARHTKRLAKISKHTDKIASLLANQQAMAGLDQYGAPIGPVAPTLGQRAGVMANNLGFGKNANPKGVFASRGGIGGRIRGAGSSALIGGAFPALFGQGGAASIGGGLGGLAGGALGGGLGFGLSLVGTVIGSKIQEAKDFEKELNKLNKAIRITGGESEFSAQSIKQLGKDLGLNKQEALQAAQAFEAFGASARVNLIQTFGDESTFNTLKNLQKTTDVLNNIDFIEKKIGKTRADQAVNVALAAGGLEAQKLILEEMFRLQTEEAKKEGNKLTGMDKFKATASSMVQTLLGQGGKRNTFIARLQNENIDEAVEETLGKQAAAMREFNEELRRLASREIVEKLAGPKEALTELLDPLNQLLSASEALGNAFSSSFKGIISGSMSAQEALKNMFSRIADHFADMAAQIIAKQIQMMALNIGLNFFSAGLAPSRGANTGGTDKFGRDFDSPAFGMPKGVEFASGGYVTRPTVGLVGEAGENEYVIPASKMASSMQRYSSGARGNAVVAGGGSSYAGGGGGSSTTVSYSGPILNFNSEEFVPKSAIGEIIATATARGARAGETRTLTSLQNSRSRRATLGL